MNFDERLDAAASKPRPHRDVTVILDEDAAAERDRLVQELAQAEKDGADDQRLSAPQPDISRIRAALSALEESARDSMVTLRFVRLPGDLWAEITWAHPAGKKSALDVFYGYDVNGVVRAVTSYVAPDGEQFAFRVEGDEQMPMPADRWAKLLRTVTGNEAAAIRDAVFSLNEFEPSQRIEALVKSFGTATRSEKN